MDYEKSSGTFLSSDNKTNISYFVYKPVGEAKAMMQISHGMAEHVERYENLIDYLTGLGILVFGNNHLGHKGSVASDADLGFMAEKDGWKFMMKDVHVLSLMMKHAYPELPLFLYGHSMGSFIARAVIANWGNDYDGAIICGTGGRNKAAGTGMALLNFLKAFKGARGKSKLMYGMMFGGYLKRIPKAHSSFDWLSRDPSLVKTYEDDLYSGFIFTLSALKDLMSVLMYVSTDEWDQKVPAQLPIFMISGAEDPVGDYGEGVKEVDSRLRKIERKDYQMKLYEGMRHEIHNEIGKEEVYQDIANFIIERA